MVGQPTWDRSGPSFWACALVVGGSTSHPWIGQKLGHTSAVFCGDGARAVIHGLEALHQK